MMTKDYAAVMTVLIGCRKIAQWYSNMAEEDRICIFLAIVSERESWKGVRDLKQLLETTAGKSCQKAFDNI